jgi:hypothetical protein
MMRAMSKRTVIVAAALSLIACGGGGKGADSPGTCPEGTVLKGDDCLPSGDVGSSSGGGGSSTKSEEEAEKRLAGGGSNSAGGGGGGDDTSSSSGKTPYDKDAVEVQLKRAARQVKSSCGAATDTDGKASGPWGTTKASVTLGRNGHVKGVAVPSPYDGKPVGDCVVHAFERIQFPPYAGSTDVVVDWDIEIVHPKH